MKKILFSALALVALASCSKSEDVLTPEIWSGELRISSGIETRASGTLWDSGDSIGVFMNLTTPSAGEDSVVGVANTKYTTTKALDTDPDTYSSATFTVATDYADLLYPQSGNVDIVAHYPFNSGATVSSYPINVKTQTEPKNIDFMSAKMEGVAKGSSVLNLTFYHLLSQLNITLAAATNGALTTADLATATVKVSGTQVEAVAAVDYDTTEDLPTATYTPSGDATDLSLTASSNVASFIVVPQTASVTFTITLADGVTSYSTSATSLTFTSGNKHNYTLTVSNSAVTISGTTISSWGDGDSGSFDAVPVVL